MRKLFVDRSRRPLANKQPLTPEQARLLRDVRLTGSGVVYIGQDQRLARIAGRRSPHRGGPRLSWLIVLLLTLSS